METRNHQPAFSQIYEKRLYNGRIAIYTRINNFKCGELDPKASTFYCAHRTSKNIMRMFNGLGMNEELLTQYKFRYIIVPFNTSQLKTTRLKWIRDGKISPFCNAAVDSQIIMSLHKINLVDLPDDLIEQPSLFSVA